MKAERLVTATGAEVLGTLLITPVSDRPGHDRRHAIPPTRISTELGWQPRHSFEEELGATVRWYLEQQGWCQRVQQQGDQREIIA